MLSDSRRASTNASIGFRTHARARTSGVAGRSTRRKLQCDGAAAVCALAGHFAPPSIHAPSVAISASLKGAPTGGIANPFFVLLTRWITLLAALPPGTITLSGES